MELSFIDHIRACWALLDHVNKTRVKHGSTPTSPTTQWKIPRSANTRHIPRPNDHAFSLTVWRSYHTKAEAPNAIVRSAIKPVGSSLVSIFSNFPTNIWTNRNERTKTTHHSCNGDTRFFTAVCLAVWRGGAIFQLNQKWMGKKTAWKSKRCVLKPTIWCRLLLSLFSITAFSSHSSHHIST